MAKHRRKPNADGSCPSGFSRSGNICVRNSKLKKVGRQPGESKQDCINRGVELLIGEGFSTSQARAIAEQQCSKVGKCFWSNVINEKM